MAQRHSHALVPTFGPYLVASVAFLLLSSLLACNDGERSPTGPTAAPALESSTSRRPGARTIDPRPVTTSGATTRIVMIGPSGASTFTDNQSGGVATSVHVGDTVQWNWGSGPHSTTSGTCTSDYYGENCNPDGLWDSGLQSPPFTFSQKFTTAGSYRYFCSRHGGMMTGIVVVVP